MNVVRRPHSTVLVALAAFAASLLPLMPGWKTMRALAPTLMYDIALTEDLPPVDRFRGIEVPVQVIAGAKSPVGLHDVARQLADAIPSSAIRILEGQNHMVSTKALLPVLREFLLDPNAVSEQG